jgi:uncharacterized membrane protein
MPSSTPLLRAWCGRAALDRCHCERPFVVALLTAHTHAHAHAQAGELEATVVRRVGQLRGAYLLRNHVADARLRRGLDAAPDLCVTPPGTPAARTRTSTDTSLAATCARSVGTRYTRVRWHRPRRRRRWCGRRCRRRWRALSGATQTLPPSLPSLACLTQPSYNSGTWYAGPRVPSQVGVGGGAAVHARCFADPSWGERRRLQVDAGGHDVNVTGVWREGVRGKGVTVALVDDGACAP